MADMTMQSNRIATSAVGHCAFDAQSVGGKKSKQSQWEVEGQQLQGF